MPASPFLTRWPDLDRVAVTLASASLLPLMAAPMNLHWLAWVAYVPMFWVLRPDTPKQNRKLAYLYGFFSVLLIFRWVADTVILFSNIPAPGAYALLGLFSAAFGLPYLFIWGALHPIRRRYGAAWMLAFPAWLVVVEFITMYVVLFPYNQGISQFGFAPVRQIFSVTGVWGASYLVFFVNSVLAEAMYRRQEGRPLPVLWLSAAVALLSSVILWGHARYERIEAQLAEAPELRVALIQTDKTMTHRFSESRRQALYDWVHETRLLIDATDPGDIDLVVWSEGASPYNVHEGRVHDIIKALAQAGDFEIFVGGGTINVISKTEFEAYNSVYLFGRDGQILGRYDKNIPLPFGEYMPLANVFPWLTDLIKGPGDFRAGTDAEVLQGQVRIAAPICYEAILPSMCRRFDSPQLVINPTNDAWFGDTAAPWLHGMLATARTTELGLPMVRSGYTGVSFIAEPHGRVYGEMPPFTRGNKVFRVRMLDLPTIYRRFGDWFVWLCVIGLAAGWLVLPWRRIRNHERPAP